MEGGPLGEAVANVTPGSTSEPEGNPSIPDRTGLAPLLRWSQAGYQTEPESAHAP
ncbi:MAG: hypothetical protein WCL10_16015 [Novosphingobium sp.]|jgi:hypothetical protein|uniref:hypothetical protein n=1 Tax=Novosphingobium sp. TaxID=1874826 RepID=UPI00301B6484